MALRTRLRAEAHCSVTEAAVGTGALARHVVRELDEGSLWLVGTGIGRPRLWQYATRAALAGFERGVAGAPSGLARIQAGMNSARRDLAAAAEALLERDPPDAALVALALEGSSAHVLSLGTMRAYLHRQGQTRRLTPRDEHERGLLTGPGTVVTEAIRAGDLLMLGSATAFSTRAVGRVAAALQGDRRAPVSMLAGLLTDPAGKAGVGAAAAVIRIH